MSVVAAPPDSRALRTALGRYATGVTIVSCIDAQGGYVGLQGFLGF